MTAQVKAELLKVRSTRTTAGLLAGMILLTLLIVILSGLLTRADGLASERDQLSLFGNGGVALIFSSLAGVLLITSEYRYGTIHPTLLSTPRRWRVLSAKVTAGLLAGLAFGAAAVGLALGIGSLILTARGIPPALHGGQIALLIVGGLAGVARRAGRRARRDRSQPSGRGHRPNGLGLRHQRPAVRACTVGRPFHADTGRQRPDGAQDPASPPARCRRRRPPRLDADARARRTRTDTKTRRDLNDRPAPRVLSSVPERKLSDGVA